MSLALANVPGSGYQQVAATSPARTGTVSAVPARFDGCKVFVGAEPGLSYEKGQVLDCFQKSGVETQESSPGEATHYFLFITDTFLKSKEHVLPLISCLADPHFKQRVFPIISKTEKLSLTSDKANIFRPGDERQYVQYWSDKLNAMQPGSQEYNDVKTIQDNIAAFVCVLRDSLMPPLDELLQKDLAPITDVIEKRAHLLGTKRFFFLPQVDAASIYGRDATLAQLASLFAKQGAVTVSGEPGIGKTALAIEFAKRAESYPSGIFLLNAKDEQTLEDSFRQLAAQLGTSVDQTKRELLQMKDYLLIYDNVSNPNLIPSFSSVHTLIIGSNLPNADITLTALTDTEADRFLQDQLSISAEEARGLAKVLENHPGKLKGAIAYIKSSKITIARYIDYYKSDYANLMTKQQLLLQAKTVSAPTQQSTSILDPLPQTIEKFSKLPASQLSQELKDQDIQIFVSYNWGATAEVDKIDAAFKAKSIDLLRDIRELRSFDMLREFMKKVIREADYTFTVINNGYLKSFNCLFEVITTMQDPYWRKRVFPIVLPEVNLDDQKIAEIELHWQQEAARLENAGGTATEIAIAKEGARKIGPFLQFVRQLQPEPLSAQLSTEFQNTMALMLARQEVLEKKGIYKQAIFHLPMGRNKDFTGREREMALLEDSLKKGQFSAITNTGMGGVGKSQLALEYAYRHQNEYEMLYWIRSEDMGTIKSDLRMLGLEMGIAEDFLKDDKVISTMKGVLEKQKNWLLVFDNAEDPKLLAEVMPQRGGHILVTSRNKNWDKAVSVDVFSPEEALHYLQQISGISGQEEQFRLLAEELGYLPLALTQAGAYIRKQQIDVATYRAAFKEGQKQMLSQKERGYPGSVATAWLMSMEKIAKEDPNATKLLNICSFLAPDNIPDTVLEVWLKDKNKGASDLDFQDALRVLESYSLIDQKVVQKEGAHKKLISIHRLIQAVTRDECETEEASKAIELGVDVLNRQLKKEIGTKEELEEGEAIVEHAKSLFSCAERRKQFTQELASLVSNIGYFLSIIGYFTESKAMHEKALKIFIDCLGTENHSSVAGCYCALGIVLHNQLDLAGAEEMYARALEIEISCRGNKNHTELTYCYINLANVFSDQEDFAKAQSMYEKALEIEIGVLGTETNTKVAGIYNNLGTVLQAQENFAEAQRMYEKALKITIDCFGNENHLLVAVYYKNMGDILLIKGDLAGAKAMYEKALQIRIDVLGNEKHIEVASTYNDLGILFYNQRDFDRAKVMFGKVLQISIACQGTEHHIRVADSYKNLGNVLLDQGNLAGAKAMFEKAREIYIICLGTENQTDVAESYQNIGFVLEKQGDLTGAKGMYEKVLGIYNSCLGTENHPSVAESYKNLGNVCLQLNQKEQAREHYNKAKQIYQHTSGNKYDAFYARKIRECNAGRGKKCAIM